MQEPLNADTNLLATASATAESQADWVALILREFSRSQATGFFLDVAKGAVLGAAVGVVMALLACWFFSRLGWYDLRIRFARGLRWTVFTLVVLLSALFFSVMGFWSGALRGAERVLAHSQLATDAFPKIAEVIADGMAWVQLHAQHPTDTNAIATGMELFRQGRRELRAPEFATQLDQLRNDTVSGLVKRLEQIALERTPQLKGGVTEKLLHQFLDGIGRLVVEKKATSELKSWGADRIYLAIRTDLVAEAGKTGDTKTISRSELSAFLVREGIVPGIMKPIRSAARAQQLPLLALALGVLVIPPVCIRLGRSRFGGGLPKPPVSPATPPVIS